MPKRHGYRIVILAGVFLAAVTPAIETAFGSETPAALSAPTIEHVDDGRSGGLELKPPAAQDVRPPTADGLPDTNLILVTRQSCRLSLGNAPLSAIPLLGGDDRHGQWVLLAGVGWNRESDFGAKGPVWIETQGSREPVNWYFTVEMLFIPEGRWNFRASLAIDGEQMHDALAGPGPQLNPLHVGVAIAFDPGDENPLVLNLGYGRLPLEGRILSVPPDGAPTEQVLAETRIFSACLNIQW
jgi:hypothetical protein